MRSNGQVTVNLAPYFNNAGIASSCDPAADGLDGMGTILRAEDLPASGATVRCNGTSFVFPDKSDGAHDNIACEVQETPLPIGRYRALHVLGLCDWRATAEIVLLHSPDGSRTQAVLGLSDASHYKGLQYGEREAFMGQLISPDSLTPHVFLFGITPPGEDYQMQETLIEAGIWHQVIELKETPLLSHLVMPDNPSMHIFALTLCQEAGSL